MLSNLPLIRPGSIQAEELLRLTYLRRVFRESSNFHISIPFPFIHFPFLSPNKSMIYERYKSQVSELKDFIFEKTVPKKLHGQTLNGPSKSSFQILFYFCFYSIMFPSISLLFSFLFFFVFVCYIIFIRLIF